jgi:hypothetical protein
LFSLLLAAGIFWISLETAERWYYTGWAGMQAVARKKKAAHAAWPATGSPLLARLRLVVDQLLSAPIQGIMWKDSLVLRRDLRQFSQLITPLIFGIIYGFIFLRQGGEPPPGRGEAPDWFMDSLSTLMSYGNILLSIFVGWMLLQRLGGMGFSAEGKNYWLLKTAPIRARQVLMDCSGGLSAGVGIEHPVPGGLFPFAAHGFLRIPVQPVGDGVLPGRDGGPVGGVWSGRGELQLGRPAQDERRQLGLCGFAADRAVHPR